MLTEIYIEALLVDEEMADQVWEVLDSDLIEAETALFAWLVIALNSSATDKRNEETEICINSI